jgi:hypothetical protein
LAKGNALGRFNSLNLVEQIALKLARKNNGEDEDDDESNSLCSLGSMDSGYEEEKGCGGDENLDLPSHVFMGSQRRRRLDGNF